MDRIVPYTTLIQINGWIALGVILVTLTYLITALLVLRRDRRTRGPVGLQIGGILVKSGTILTALMYVVASIRLTQGLTVPLSWQFSLGTLVLLSLLCSTIVSLCRLVYEANNARVSARYVAMIDRRILAEHPAKKKKMATIHKET